MFSNLNVFILYRALNNNIVTKQLCRNPNLARGDLDLTIGDRGKEKLPEMT